MLLVQQVMLVPLLRHFHRPSLLNLLKRRLLWDFQVIVHLNLVFGILTREHLIIWLGLLIISILFLRRLGHPHSEKLLTMFRNGLILNKLVNSKSYSSNVCASCCIAKSKILPFSNSSHTSCKPFELLHSDVWGPAPIISSSGYRYFVTFIDDYSKFTRVYLLHSKSEVFTNFKYFVAMVENQFQIHIHDLSCWSRGRVLIIFFYKISIK